MELLPYLIKLKDWFSSQITKTENIDRQNPEKWLERIQELKSDLIQNQEMAQEMIDGISGRSVDLNPDERRNLEKQIKILEENEADNEKRIARLEKEIFRLDGQIEILTESLDGVKVELNATRNGLEITRNELSDTRDELTRTQNDHEITRSELRKMENALKTGQIAFDFEKDLATYVYPHDKKFGSRKIFTQMKIWLEDKRDTAQGKEANEKWHALKEEFSWSSEHERVFFKLLESRKEFAHPALDRNEAQSQIPNDYSAEEKKCIQDILGMIERVNTLMQQQ